MKKVFVLALIAASTTTFSCGQKNQNGANQISTIAEKTTQAQVDETVAQKAEQDGLAALMPTFKQVDKICDATEVKRLKDNDPMLKGLGIKCLEYCVEPEECFDIVNEFYGKNASVVKSKNEDGWYDFRVKPTGPHAVVISICHSSDTSKCVYFSDKSDFNRFLKTIPSSACWEQGEMQDGMYVVQEYQ